jgi:hypothetical protein
VAISREQNRQLSRQLLFQHELLGYDCRHCCHRLGIVTSHFCLKRWPSLDRLPCHEGPMYLSSHNLPPDRPNEFDVWIAEQPVSRVVRPAVAAPITALGFVSHAGIRRYYGCVISNQSKSQGWYLNTPRRFWKFSFGLLRSHLMRAAAMRMLEQGMARLISDVAVTVSCATIRPAPNMTRPIWVLPVNLTSRRQLS